jgi:alpha-N-arabinofuranosidase
MMMATTPCRAEVCYQPALALVLALAVAVPPPAATHAAAAAAAAATQAQVTVRAGAAHELSPVLYSMFLETEINYGGEGGLYAELLRNRDFEALGRAGRPEPAANLSDHAPWVAMGGATVGLDNTTAPFATNPITMRLRGQAGDGVSNPGYWGVGCGSPGVGFNLSFYSRSAAPLTLTVRLRGGEGPEGDILSSATVSVAGTSQWLKNTAVLPACTAAATAATAFEMVFQTAGDLQLDSVSLMPSDAVAGVFRRDILEKLRELRPGFIRTPGGSCACDHLIPSTTKIQALGGVGRGGVG